MTASTLKLLHTQAYRSATIGTAFNVVGHPGGGAHAKVVIVGTKTQVVGFTGGIDFVSDRYADRIHRTFTNHDYDEFWHDVVAMVEGGAVQGLFDWYRDMWNACARLGPEMLPMEPRIASDETTGIAITKIRGPIKDTILPTAIVRAPSDPPAPLVSVQSLRTIPQFRFRPLSRLPRGNPITIDGVVQTNGLFEFAAAMYKAISNADTYIYMEDQSFWAREIMEWIADSMNVHPNLRVILLSSGQGDPNDAPPPEAPMSDAINHGLLKRLTSTADQARVRFFRRTDVTVHAKTTIIDDAWALIGSANCMRRSLYTDLEHSVSFVGDPVVRDYRCNLWGEHFGQPAASFSDLQDSLDAWDPTSGSSIPFNAQQLEPVPLPLFDSKFFTRIKYNKALDVDSREPWGCP